MIDKLRYTHPVAMLCQLVDVAKSGVLAQEAEGGIDAPFRPWQPVLQPGLPGIAGELRHADIDESQGQLLGQRADGKLLRYVED